LIKRLRWRRECHRQTQHAWFIAMKTSPRADGSLPAGHHAAVDWKNHAGDEARLIGRKK
jgi:hypothetical protein